MNDPRTGLDTAISSTFSRIFGASLVALTLLTAAACGSDDDSQSDDDGDGSAAAADDSANGAADATTATDEGAPAACANDFNGDAACSACLAASCCDATSTCAGDESCWTCVTKLDVEVCHQTPEIHAMADDFWICQANECQAECYGGESAAVPSCEDVFPGECGACLENSCCAQLAGCVGNDDCFACVTNPSPDVCHADPGGHALAHALWDCTAEHCDAQCSQ